MGSESVERSAFTLAFGAALDSSGISLSSLQRRLDHSGNPVSIATLSYWRSGRRIPHGASSLAVVEELERLLSLPADTLLGVIPERVRVRPQSSPVIPFAEEQVQEAVSETMQILDAPPLGVTRNLSIHAVNDVGADGYLRRQKSTTLFQSVVQHTLSEVTTLLVSDGVPLDVLEMRVRGAQIVRSHLHARKLAYAAVMRLDQPLTFGASAMLETVVECNPDSATPQSEVGVATFRRMRDLVMWTRFDPAAMPDWIDVIETLEGAEEKDVRSIRPQVSVQQSRHDFGPGALGISWGYDAWDDALRS